MFFTFNAAYLQYVLEIVFTFLPIRGTHPLHSGSQERLEI